MATKSRALKAKTPTRKAKREVTCPVEALGRENDRLICRIRALSASPDENASETTVTMNDKMRANEVAATFLQPRSMMGVAFLVHCIASDVETMRDSEGAEKLEAARRARRALGSILDWFFFDRNVSIGSVGSVSYMPDRPNRLLAADAARAGAAS